MSATPTRHRNVYTADPVDLPELLRTAAAAPTLAVADPALAARLGLPAPPLPPGRLRDCVTAEAAAAGVPETAVMLVAVALITEAATPLMPPALASIQMPPTVIIGSSPAQTEAVLQAAEAVAASSRGRRRA
jgi:hypothetical protein